MVSIGRWASWVAMMWTFVVVVVVVRNNFAANGISLPAPKVLTLNVSSGQLAYLRPEDLNIVNPFHENEPCKVEVIQNDPATQIFGKMSPKVFDCDFPFGRVTYEHFGSFRHSTSEDRVKLRIIDFSGNVTRFHEIDVVIVVPLQDEVERRRNNATAIIKGPLLVTEFFGLSRPIDRRVLEFRPGGGGGARMMNCVVRFQFDRGWPRHGRMVSGLERRPLIEQELVAYSCDEFLYLGLRYEHLRPPTPNEDYVGLLVDVLEDGVRRRERIQLKVVIQPGLPNVPPRLSESSSLKFLVKSNWLEISFLTPAVLSADDDESPPKLIVFKLIKGFSPFQGHLFHVADNSRRSLTSFTQDDLLKKRIVYCPPVHQYYDRIRFQIRFDILDGDFGVSKTPATVNVELSRINYSQLSGTFNYVFQLPRIVVRMGLVVLEGRSKPLQINNHLQLMTPPLPANDRIAVVIGPNHGRLAINGSQVEVFTWSQLERQLVVYEHNGDDDVPTGDSVHLKISDDPDDDGFFNVVLPIVIIPEDDSPPQLIVNNRLSVFEGETVALSADSLRAVDVDSRTEEITYVVIENPRHGILFKHRVSFSVTNFTEADIDDGLVFYKHNKGGDDSNSYDKTNLRPRFDKFKLRLQDGHQPPNMSPLHMVHVKIDTRSSDVGDRLRPSSTIDRRHAISVRETEVLLLDSHMLHYVHLDGRDVDIMYDIVSPPRGLDGSTDGGKLVLLGHTQVSIIKSELARLSETKSFNQHQLDARRVAYLSPQKDVGPTLLRVAFKFSVRDRHGTGNISEQHFNITVFPVNDKPPMLYTGVLVVFNGVSSVVSVHALSAVDEDTPAEDLLITLSQLPYYGAVLLDHVPLAVGSNFTTSDVDRSRVTYAHRDAQSTSDRIHLILTDGVHLVTGSILVHVVPGSHDGTNRLAEDDIVEEKEGLTVNEGDDIIITPEVLIGDVLDTESDFNARFFVVQNPNLGSIQVRGKSNDVFTQDDLIAGRVKYVHNGSVEIGPSSQLDDIHFMLVDESSPAAGVRQQKGRSGGSIEESVHTLRITILPVDNAAPYLELGPDVPLVVPEGSTVPLGRHVLEALDLDSKTEDVALVVTRPPIYGHLANVRPVPRLAEVSAPILSFRLKDLDDETVHYVQSVCGNGSEPTADSFVLYAMDGKHRSRQVVLNVSIIPLNDEPPVVLLRNFTVTQRGDKLLDAYVFNVNDADLPRDRILVRLQSPPHYGRILVEVFGAGPQKDFSELDWNDSKLVSLIYRHEGKSILMDNFTLFVSDGVHALTRTAFVEIFPYESRSTASLHRVVTNKGLHDVIAGDYRFIANTALNAEMRTEVERARYILRRAPRHGVLQLFRSALSWTNLTTGSIFTQQDIDSLSLRYVHTDLSFQNTNDDFGFVVYTGDVYPHANAQVEVFLIEMKRDRGLGDVIVSVEPAEVVLGGQVVLGPSIIKVDPRNNNPNDVVFRIIVPPAHGRVIRLRHPNILVVNFTLIDIHGQGVAYVHSGDLTTPDDRIRIGVFIGAIGPARSTVDIAVRVNLPLAAKYEIYAVDPLVVPADIGIIDLKTMKFRATDSDAIYSLVEEPQFGKLLLDGRPLKAFSTNSSFAQRHVDDGRVAYRRHLGSGLDSDMLHFRVVTPSMSIDHRTVTSNTQNVSVEIVVDTATQVETLPTLKLISPDALENFEGQTQGFTLSSDYIKLSFGDSVQPNVHFRFRYVVKSPPKHGRLERQPENRRSTSSAATQVQNFTQHDVDNRLIRYVLLPEAIAQTGSTSDTFELSIVESVGVESLAVAMMDLRWSLVYFMQSEYGVCEDVGRLSLPVYRASNLDRLSSVGIGIVGGGGHSVARQFQDYGLSRKRTIKFNPDVASVNWDISIINDGVEEADIETFVVQLKNPENAVIYGGGKVTVNIYDKKKDSCFHLTGSEHHLGSVMSTTTTTMATNDWSRMATTSAPIGANPVCNWQTIGAPLSITIGTSTINLVCDGNTWISASTSAGLLMTTTVSPMSESQKLFRARERKASRRAAKKSMDANIEKLS